MLTGSDYRRVVDAVPNLVATKNTGATVSGTADLIHSAPELQHFFGESTFPIGCLHGECSLLSSYGPMLPARTKEFFEYGRTGQIEKVFQLQKEYLTVVEEILAPLRAKELIDGAYDKVLLRLAGSDMPLRLLSPYESFTEETYKECRDVLERHRNWVEGR